MSDAYLPMRLAAVAVFGFGVVFMVAGLNG
jgi:hypothetical protein